MRRILEVLQTVTLATRQEANVLIWLTLLLATGTVGSALFPERSQHYHISPQAVLAHIDSTVAKETASDTATSLRERDGKPPTKPVATINVNKASPRDLELIPGIGPAMAERIVAHRKTRRFTCVEDLLDVKGIGKKKLEKMRPYIIAP